MTQDYNKIQTTNVAPVTKDEEEEKVELERPKMKQVAVAQKKKSGVVERFFKGMVGPDGIKGIVTHLTGRIIVPAIKDVLADTLTTGITMAIYGENAPVKGRHVGNGTNYTRYSKPSGVSTNVVTAKSINTVDNYVFTQRSEAEEVLRVLIETAANYDVVSVADYYDMIGVPTQYTHNDYGWTYQTISRVRVGMRGSQYFIELPRPEGI